MKTQTELKSGEKIRQGLMLLIEGVMGSTLELLPDIQDRRVMDVIGNRFRLLEKELLPYAREHLVRLEFEKLSRGYISLKENIPKGYLEKLKWNS